MLTNSKLGRFWLTFESLAESTWKPSKRICGNVIKLEETSCIMDRYGMLRLAHSPKSENSNEEVEHHQKAKDLEVDADFAAEPSLDLLH